MYLPAIARPLLAALLLTAGTAAPAWDGRTRVIAPTAWIGFSFGTPAIHRHGYHYQPRWPAYAPYPGYGRGYYPPRHGRAWYGYGRHHPHRWSRQHHHRGGRHAYRGYNGHHRDRWRH